MLTKVNTILLRRKNKLKIQQSWRVEERDTISNNIVATFQKNLEGLGYTLGPSLIDELKGLDWEEYWLDIKNALVELKGIRRYEPLYPNFPKQVMSASEVELYLNALLHYATVGEWKPEYIKETRLPLNQKDKLITIEKGTDKDVTDLINNLILSKTSLSFTDKFDLETLIKATNYHDFPLEIPYKENLGFICKLIIKQEEDSKDLTFLENTLASYLKTPTDLLRVLLDSEGGKPIKYNRRMRKMFLKLFEAVYNPDDIKRHRMDWVKVGEMLHPGEYKKQFPNAYKYFSLIRSDYPIKSYYSKLEKEIETGNILEIVDLLSKRPGEFARKLDFLLREYKEDYLFIILQFMEIVDRVSTPVLIQIYDHFNNRNLKNRNFMLKKTGKLVSIENNLKEIPQNIIALLRECIKQALINKFKKKEKWGKVYLSESFKNFMIPFSQRTASKTSISYTRGSRLKIEKNVIRTFIWWTNNSEGDEGRVDIDLSVAALDENWNLIDHVSYTNLKTEGITHSGDITRAPAPKGACEFLDIDLRKINSRVKYITFTVHNFYPNGSFTKINNCFFGYSERENAFEGEIFEPSTVKNKFDIKIEASTYLPLIFDVEKREFIWADFTNNGQFRFCNNIESNSQGINKIAKSIFELNRMSLYELIELNVKGRGELIDNKEEANLIFDMEEGIKPSDLDFFMSECL